MPRSIDVLLCERQAAGGPLQLRAVLDELTLTYTIEQRGPSRRTRELRRHVSSLREARRWATLYAAQPSCADQPEADKAA